MLRDGDAVQGEDGKSGQQPRPAGLADALDRFLLFLVVISATLGIAIPGPGRHLDAGGAILVTLAVLVFCTGSSLTFTEIAAIRNASRRLLLVVAVATVTLPALAWLASQLVDGPPLRGGVLAAGVAPAEVASVALTGLAGGEVALAAGLLVASTMLTVLLAGPILSLLGAHSSTSQLGLLSTLALVVALPLVAGTATRTLGPFGGREQSLVRILGTASLLVLLWEVASEFRLRASDARVVVAQPAGGRRLALLRMGCCVKPYWELLQGRGPGVSPGPTRGSAHRSRRRGCLRDSDQSVEKAGLNPGSGICARQAADAERDARGPLGSRRPVLVDRQDREGRHASDRCNES